MWKTFTSSTRTTVDRGGILKNTASNVTHQFNWWVEITTNTSVILFGGRASTKRFVISTY